MISIVLWGYVRALICGQKCFFVYSYYVFVRTWEPKSHLQLLSRDLSIGAFIFQRKRIHIDVDWSCYLRQETWE